MKRLFLSLITLVLIQPSPAQQPPPTAQAELAKLSDLVALVRIESLANAETGAPLVTVEGSTIQAAPSKATATVLHAIKGSVPSEKISVHPASNPQMLTQATTSGFARLQTGAIYLVFLTKETGTANAYQLCLAGKSGQIQAATIVFSEKMETVEKLNQPPATATPSAVRKESRSYEETLKEQISAIDKLTFTDMRITQGLQRNQERIIGLVKNEGDLPIHNLQVSLVIKDKDGKLLDVLSNAARIPLLLRPGQQVAFEAVRPLGNFNDTPADLNARRGTTVEAQIDSLRVITPQ